MLYAWIAQLTWYRDIGGSAGILNSVFTRLGLLIPGVRTRGIGEPLTFDRLTELVAVAEISGFDSIWVPDEPSAEGRDPAEFEAYTLLGALAQSTDSVRLGALVTGVTNRPPALLAKQVTALDVLSSGRAVLGVGAGLPDRSDTDSGAATASLSERFERLEEALQVFRAMFTQDRVHFDGRYYRLDGAVNRPRPFRDGGPPVLIGGNGERRTLKLVADYADACNLSGELATIRRKMVVLESHCVASGRDLSSITKTMLATLIIAPSESQALERVEELRSRSHPEDTMSPPAVICGSPDSVTRQVAQFLDVGIDGLIVNMPDFQETEFVALAGKVLSRSL